MKASDFIEKLKKNCILFQGAWIVPTKIKFAYFQGQKQARSILIGIYVNLKSNL